MKRIALILIIIISLLFVKCSNERVNYEESIATYKTIDENHIVYELDSVLIFLNIKDLQLSISNSIHSNGYSYHNDSILLNFIDSSTYIKRIPFDSIYSWTTDTISLKDFYMAYSSEKKPEGTDLSKDTIRKIVDFSDDRNFLRDKLYSATIDLIQNGNVMVKNKYTNSLETEVIKKVEFWDIGSSSTCYYLKDGTPVICSLFLGL